MQFLNQVEKLYMYLNETMVMQSLWKISFMADPISQGNVIPARKHLTLFSNLSILVC
jgi:hypothetical protein